MDVAAFLKLMEQLAPWELAEPWDNVGLQLGSRHWPVTLIWVALDPDPRVVTAAAQAGVDLLIAHHPLIMTPLKSIDIDSAWGAAMGTAITGKMAIVASHTNLDAALGGINDMLGNRIGLTHMVPFIPHPDTSANGEEAFDAHASRTGIGRVGSLQPPVNLGALGEGIKSALALDHLRVVGDPDLMVSTAALSSGSGGSLIDKFLGSNHQVFITGDVKYHQAREVEIAGRGLIDIGHFASEHLFIEPLIHRLSALIPPGNNIRIEACPLETDPFTIM